MPTFRTALTLAATLAAPALYAQQVQQEGPVPTTALIRVESKANAPIGPSTLTLELNGQPVPLDFVTPVAPQTTEVAILIDEGFAAQRSASTRRPQELPHRPSSWRSRHGGIYGQRRRPFGKQDFLAGPRRGG